MSAAVEQIFATSGEIVRIERAYAVSRKAHSNARNASFFPRICPDQCCRFVMSRLGVRYITQMRIGEAEGMTGILEQLGNLKHY